MSDLGRDQVPRFVIMLVRPPDAAICDCDSLRKFKSFLTCAQILQQVAGKSVETARMREPRNHTSVTENALEKIS
jgi:hypothetical protein